MKIFGNISHLFEKLIQIIFYEKKQIMYRIMNEIKILYKLFEKMVRINNLYNKKTQRLDEIEMF